MKHQIKSALLSAAAVIVIGQAAFSQDTSIRPFTINIPEKQLVDLHHRIAATKWPEKETVTDATQGVRLETMQALAHYWQNSYDWRKIESRLNTFPQFLTNIDGLDIHFIHVRSKNPHALPIIVTHGWPGSVIEQLKIIGPLTDPVAYGGNASDAFDVVIPSLPGYGFSGKPAAAGWDPARVARAWVVLMKRLGYTRFVAQGGDWGNAVTEQMALLAPPELLGIHTNMPATVPDDVARSLQYGTTPPTGLTSEEKHAYDQLDGFYKHGLGYALEMANRPQTLYGIEDSPIGLAGWILDHDSASQALIARVFAGGSEGLTRDDILDNITLYWLTGTAVSSARLYWENKFNFFAPKHVTIPVAVSVFPDEIYAAPRSWAEKVYPNLIHYNRLPKGGHFAAWEQPKALTEELRTAFRPLRSAALTSTITIDNANIAYRILGPKSGIPLVLLSPLGWSMDDWDPIIVDGLAKHSTVIVFDYKGVGGSSGKTPTTIAAMANDAVSFIKALGYTRVNLLGFSMGGFVAQQIVETEPQLVNKLILTGTGPQGSKGLAEVGKKVSTAGNLSPEEQYLHFLFAPSASSRQLGEASFARIHAKTTDRDLPISQESFVAELTAVLGWAQPDPKAFEHAKAVTNPVLIIGGQYDFFIPAVNELNLYQAMPNSRLLLLPDAGHAVMNQYPAVFLQETNSFLKN